MKTERKNQNQLLVAVGALVLLAMLKLGGFRKKGKKQHYISGSWE